MNAQETAELLARECAQRVCIFPSKDYKIFLDALPLVELLNVAEAAQATMDEAHLAAATLGKDMTPKQFDLSQTLAALRAKLPKGGAK